MPYYMVTYTGAVTIEAENEKEAADVFMQLNDTELGQSVEEYADIQELEDSEVDPQHETIYRREKAVY